MSAIRLSHRYAKALISQAIESGKVDAVSADVEGLISLLDNNEIKLLMKSPIINAGKKKSVFKALIGGKVEPLTEAFINILISKGREAHMQDVAKAFQLQYEELKMRSSVKITTATPMKESQFAKLKAEIIDSKVTHPDLTLETIVDEDIIGGFILDISDKQYDASVKSKLDELRRTFSDDSYSKKI